MSDETAIHAGADADAQSGTRPPLSVIVPTHDTRALTERCFATLARACAREHELILVDDASSDGTADAIVSSHPRVRVVRLEGPQGFTAAANAGLAAARGEILWLLNSDTEVAPDAPDALVAAFARNPWLGVAGAALRDPDGRPQWSGGRAPSLAWQLALSSGVAPLLGRLPGYRRVKPIGAQPGAEVDWVPGAALAIRRATFERVGLLDARFRCYAQDVDLCLRARDQGWQVMIVPEAQVVHHVGATIGRGAGAVAGRWHAADLWTDLVRLAAKRGGRSAARRSRAALLAGATGRIALRRLTAPLVPADAREAWRRDDDALAAGVAALRDYDVDAELARNGRDATER